MEVTLDASELDNMDQAMLKDKYEDTLASAKQAREDVSDVFEEQVMLSFHKCFRRMST